jgi:hypothetical protein
MNKTEWFNRKFPSIEDNGTLPSIIERLAGTPARLEEMISKLDESVLTIRIGEKWSIKEEAGHLPDLEPLWSGRLDDLINKFPELRAADLSNQRTHKANHNATEVNKILKEFRDLRKLYVDKLMRLNNEQLTCSALHPRLKTPMRVIDLAYFVAEHDDHHLSRIREIINSVILPSSF